MKQRDRKSICKPVCGDKCQIKCREKFSENRRKDINANFWKLQWDHRRAYVQKMIQKKKVSRRRKMPSVDPKRSFTFVYNLPNENGDNVQVCKTMFCNVLNISDKTIRNSLDENSSLNDQRGKHRHPDCAIDHQEIKDDIERYHPCVHHYRREHAPLRRYLPSDIRIVDMHREFNRTRAKPISYTLYQKVFHEMNISMTKLGNEECEECQDYFVHKDALNECSPSCEKCKSYTLHKERAKNSRTAYRSDAELPNSDSDIIVSADLQKVIMLPRTDMFKIVLFTRRLCLFNETFATVGPKREDKKKVNTAYLWHEGIAGRKDEDIASTFWKFINDHRDAASITFWLDNCAGQNKNWSIFTMFSTAVNAENMNVNTIILKYFERGHTFMSADSAHAEIEEQLKKMDKVFDFKDFVKCVEKTSCRAQEMEPKAFKKWVSGTSQYKLRQSPDRPMLADISMAEFRRGHRDLFYKTEHTTDEFKSFSYLKNEFVL